VSRTAASYRVRDPAGPHLALELEALLVAAPMSELDRKGVHFHGPNLARSRDAQGRASAPVIKFAVIGQ